MHEVYRRKTRQEGKERKQAGAGYPQITEIPGKRAAIYARTAPSQEPGGEKLSGSSD